MTHSFLSQVPTFPLKPFTVKLTHLHDKPLSSFLSLSLCPLLPFLHTNTRAFVVSTALCSPTGMLLVLYRRRDLDMVMTEWPITGHKTFYPIYMLVCLLTDGREHQSKCWHNSCLSLTFELSWGILQVWEQEKIYYGVDVEGDQNEIGDGVANHSLCLFQPCSSRNVQTKACLFVFFDLDEFKDCCYVWVCLWVSQAFWARHWGWRYPWLLAP